MNPTLSTSSGSTAERLRAFIQDRLTFGRPSSPIGLDDDLLMSGILDSLAIVRLLAYIQETTGVDVPPEDVLIEHFTSINTIAAYLAGRT